MSNQREAREKASEEIHGGKKYAKTKAKHGTKVANKQAIAVYFSKKRRGEYSKRGRKK